MDESELDALIAGMHAEMPSDPFSRVELLLQLGARLLYDDDQPLQARRVFGEILADVRDLPHSEIRDQAQSTAWYNIAIAAGASGKHDEEIAIYDRLVELFGEGRDPPVRHTLAMALFNKGTRLAQDGRLEEAARAYEEVVTRFIDASEPEIRVQVAMALGAGGATRGRLGHLQDELREYDRMIALFGSDPEPAIRRHIAMTLYSKAAAVSRLGRQDDSLLVIDELMRRFADDPDPEIRKVIAEAEKSQHRFADAMMMAGPPHVALAELIDRGSYEEVVAFADAVLVGCSDPAHVALGDLVSTAMVAPALVLAREGQLDEAIRALTPMIDRLDDPSAPAMQRVLAAALMDVAWRLNQQSRFRECIQVSDQLLCRSPVASPDIEEAVGSVLSYKSLSLHALGETEAAIEACVEIIRRFPAPAEPRLGLVVAQALHNKGFLLSELGRTAEAIQALTDVSARCGDDPQPDVRRLVLNAAIEKGTLLRLQGRVAELAALWDELIERFGTAAEQEIRLEIAKVAFDRIVVLRELGEREKAIAACDTYVRFADVPHPGARGSVARARLNKGVMLSELGRMHEAVQTIDEILADSTYPGDPAARPILALALRNKGNILERLAWPEAAADVYAELVSRFAMDHEELIVEQVTLARDRLAVLQIRGT